MNKPNHQPPQWAKRLLRWFCAPHLLDEMEGDLDELFQERVESVGLRRARWRYTRDVLSLIRPWIIKRKSNQYSNPSHMDMLQNYLKIAWRNLARNKAFSVINIGGLAVGMVFTMLIGLWVRHELSYDAFHTNGDRVVMIWKNTLFNGNRSSDINMPLPLYDELKATYPDVKRITRLGGGNAHGLKAGDTKVIKQGLNADPDFLRIFSFPVLNGSLASALTEPASIVLTESTAKALFGPKNPVGQLVRLDNQHDLRVTAIVSDVPQNSTLQFDFLVPFEHVIQANSWMKEARTTQWTNNFLQTVVELHENVSTDAFSAKISPIIRRKSADKDAGTLFVHPLSKWHLQSRFENWELAGGRIEYVRLFGIIGLIVLLIACINFMNLATARSEQRAKEVGIRKAVGSQRGQLIGQFLSESLLTTFLAFVLSMLLLVVSIPLLATVGFEQISFEIINAPFLLIVLVACGLTGLLAGSYPALYLSSFVPVRVLKGTVQIGTGATLPRKILVITQFTVSVTLIISAIIVYQQIQYAKNRPLGYNPKNLISIEATPDLAKNYRVLKEELLNTGAVEAVTASSSPMTNTNNVWGDWSWPGKDANQSISFGGIMVEYDYEKTVGLKLKQGRAFSRAFPTDSSAILLNETAVKALGFKSPLGKIIKAGDGSPRTVVGVVDDVVIDDPFRPVIPQVILFMPNNASTISLRLKPTADVRQALATIQPVFERHNPAYPFEYKFVDEEFARKFTAENQAGRLAGLFAGLAIFISCLGLFGLAAYMAERRTKELGIRKVLGASVLNLWGLLSKDFVVLVVIAFFIATPIAYYFLSGWLQKYEYRTELSWWIFALSGVGAVVITLLTVSFQSIKAALMNPVKSLRSE